MGCKWEATKSYGKTKHFYQNHEFILLPNIPKKFYSQRNDKVWRQLWDLEKLLLGRKSYDTLGKFHIGIINVFCEGIRWKLTIGKLSWIFSNLSLNSNNSSRIQPKLKHFFRVFCLKALSWNDAANEEQKRLRTENSRSTKLKFVSNTWCFVVNSQSNQIRLKRRNPLQLHGWKDGNSFAIPN